MTLPPLPLVDGALLIDNSFVERLTTCARSAEYSFLHKRVSAERNSALNYGTAIHEALAWRYTHLGSKAPDTLDEEEQINLLTNLFTKSPPPLDDYRNLGQAINCIHFYNEKYADEPFSILALADNKPLVESSFAVPLYTSENGIQVVYCGRIDLVVKWDNQVFCIDHKTTSQLGDHFFQDKFMSAQLPGYCWAVEQTTNLKVAGYAINALRSKAPPVKLSSGDPKAVAGWWMDSLARDRQYVRSGQLDEWKLNAINLVDRFLWHYKRGYLPMETSWCFGRYGRCQYYGTCSLPLASRGVDLSSTNYIDNEWTPLVHPQKI